MVGRAMGNPVWATNAAEDPEVVIWLLLDPLDVDSKQVTFVRSEDKTEVFKALYRFVPEA